MKVVSKVDKEEIKENNFLRILKGSIFSIIISMILLLIFAIVLTYANVSENTIPAIIIAISNLSILFGSILCNRKIEKNGILNGIAVALIYLLVIYVISSIAIKSFSFNIKSLIMILCSLVSGILGGIIGVNLK